MKTTVYVHGSREAMWEAGEEIGISEKTLWTFRHALTELEVDLEVNVDDGSHEILEIREGEKRFLPIPGLVGYMGP